MAAALHAQWLIQVPMNSVLLPRIVAAAGRSRLLMQPNSLILHELKRGRLGLEGRHAESGQRWFLSRYAQVSLTVDIGILSKQEPRQILLIERLHEPFKGKVGCLIGWQDAKQLSQFTVGIARWIC
jgi:hypothetical protein